ncbi:MAG: hypothetical protein J7K87_04200 [Candidatus Aenigmarchaeota archaeon]|nr:hypothetical protein [Candidatus Aenigmarchaeota archaeon]
MLLLILGVIDILAGLCLLYPSLFSFMIFYVGIIVLLKGLMSFLSSVLNNYWFDWMGIVDIIVGVALLIGLRIPHLWLVPILKGLYSVVIHYATRSYL